MILQSGQEDIAQDATVNRASISEHGRGSLALLLGLRREDLARLRIGLGAGPETRFGACVFE